MTALCVSPQDTFRQPRISVEFSVLSRLIDHIVFYNPFIVNTKQLFAKLTYY